MAKISSFEMSSFIELFLEDIIVELSKNNIIGNESTKKRTENYIIISTKTKYNELSIEALRSKSLRLIKKVVGKNAKVEEIENYGKDAKIALLGFKLTISKEFTEMLNNPIKENNSNKPNYWDDPDYNIPDECDLNIKDKDFKSLSEIEFGKVESGEDVSGEGFGAMYAALISIKLNYQGKTISFISEGHIQLSEDLTEKEFYENIEWGKFRLSSKDYNIDEEYFFEVSKGINLMLKAWDIEMSNKDKKQFENKLISKVNREIKNSWTYKEIKSKIVIPNSVTKISYGEFENCSSLKEIVIPNSVTEIDSRAFDDCTKLTKVTLPSYLKSIGEHAFAGCISLKEIVIPEGVKEIEKFTFWSCRKLTSVTLPNSIKSIGYYAFDDCESLKQIVIPNSVEKIGKFAFFGCESLKEITLPDSVKEIGEYVFYGCYSLTKVILSNSVKEINKGAFYHCTNLTSITIPSSVISIGEESFWGCTSLTNIYYEGTEDEWSRVKIDKEAIPEYTTVHFIDDRNSMKDSNPTEDGMIICDHDWKDIVRIYLQWEGIIGYDNDIISYLEDEDYEGLEQYLDDEGIYGYESTLISIKEDGDAYCRGMEKEDYINICSDNGIEPQLEFEEVEIISEDELTTLVLNLIKQGKSNLEIKTELEKLDPENFDWYEADDFINNLRNDD